ncbi:unnamed protein product [Caenorhabditis auriculariae]|uniref:DUF7774 domain-containing protein n=1 Tax=Caenorhabditis auriculariae TaxID=2777116 RepID=A0A8S1HA60_9PELO|nr:unnamed protein product [Caenorhabditis auriculariae]
MTEPKSKAKKKVKESERTVKLKHMFNTYLDEKNKFSGLSEDEKKALAVKRIVDEEAEVFEVVDGARPMHVISKPVELKWKELPAAQTEAAMKVLEVLTRNQLLEYSCHRNEDIALLMEYFKEPNKQPTPKIVLLLDTAITNGLAQLERQSDTITDVIDENMRALLNDSDKAKRDLLEVMLHNPQYVPTAWGSSYCVKRLKDKQDGANEEDDKTNEDPNNDKKSCERLKSLEEFESQWTDACRRTIEERKRKAKKKDKDTDKTVEQKSDETKKGRKKDKDTDRTVEQKSDETKKGRKKDKDTDKTVEQKSDEGQRRKNKVVVDIVDRSMEFGKTEETKTKTRDKMSTIDKSSERTQKRTLRKKASPSAISQEASKANNSTRTQRSEATRRNKMNWLKSRMSERKKSNEKSQSKGLASARKTETASR